MVMEFVEGLGAWTWWILGAVLLAIEVFAPGNVFVWFGVAAILTGALALFTELSWQTELIVFIVLSVVLVVAGRRFFASRMESSDQPLLNERAVRYVGKTFVLAEPIVDGTGRIRIDDTQWRIEGADMPSGSRVKVAGVDGTVLSVVKLEG
jgi:membrane protein implicated in regulation of membrane protease activity